MFFFGKKHFLVDHLRNFVDIHNHILPGIDDGAETVEESLKLITGFEEFGVTHFICTPHIMNNYYDNTPNTIKQSYDKLNKALKQKSYENTTLRYSAEYLVDDNFENILQSNEYLPLNDTHLLIEMSYLQPSINFGDAVEKIKKRGIFPVFAHPERYQYLIKDSQKYQAFRKDGIKFQLNMLSLSEYYGKNVKKTAIRLLESNSYDFIGSDIHSLKQLLHLKNQLVLERKVLNKLLPLIDHTIETFY
ncbi:MAG: CpsB/CapC family capsule biosynthesis tyrosine phosphatase [Bacteroidota bacterium]